MPNINSSGLSQSFDGVSEIGSFRHRVIIGGLDITDYVLGGTVTKSLANPVGKWTIYIRPIIENNIVRRLPISINDVIEIRLDRKNEGAVRIVMRGFIDTEEILEKPAQNFAGSPSRSHTISGTDLAKLLERRQIYVPPDISARSLAIGLNAQIGVASELSGFIEKLDIPKENKLTMPLNTWANFFVMKVYKEEYGKILAQSKAASKKPYSITFDSNLPQFGYTAKTGTPTSGERIFVTLGPLLNNQTGSMWSFIEYYCVRPFVEIFMQDEEDFTKLTLRWTPYYTKRGLANGDAFYEWPKQRSGAPWLDVSKINFISIQNKDILEKRITRSEGDRYTYFYTNYNNFFMNPNSATPIPTSSPDDDPRSLWINPYYDDAGISQFGWKPLAINIPWFAIERDTQSLQAADFKIEMQGFLKDLTKWLAETLTYTDQLYQGYFVVPGNSNIKIGSYIKIEDTNEEYYIESVEHSWSVYPTPQFITRIGVSRGMLPNNLTSPKTTIDKQPGDAPHVQFGTAELQTSS